MSRSRKRKSKRASVYLAVVVSAALAVILIRLIGRDSFFSAVKNIYEGIAGSAQTEEIADIYIDPDTIPDYAGEPYSIINENIPELNKSDGERSFEIYADTDSYGRCRAAYANVSPYTMPDKERESIGDIRPTGWHLIKYPGIEGNYLYNRCHLIGYQLTGENANKNNLITGTRYLNTIGMLPFENTIADYIKKTGHHVLYKVVPVFEGDNMLASGVWMQALSVEDDEISFNVYCYNVQPGIYIDYTTGDSREM